MKEMEKFKSFLEENEYDNTIFEEDGKIEVGGNLYLRGTQIKDKAKELKKVQKFKQGYNEKQGYIYFDGILWGNVKSVKNRENITIYRTPLGYCVTEGELSAHGKNLKEAMDDLVFKRLKDTDVEEIGRKIRKTGKVNRLQYRAITGACRLGTEGFCRRNKIADKEEIELEELRKILVNDYGAESFWRLIDG